MSDEIDRTRNNDDQQTNPAPPEFDFARYPRNTLFHERRTGLDRRAKGSRHPDPDDSASPGAAVERRARKDRRRRIDPTTFEKQYSDDEMEFMNAMQRFKNHTGQSFPSHGDVLRVAASLGYRRLVIEPEEYGDDLPAEPALVTPSTVDA
jgi:hypothetical protein